LILVTFINALIAIQEFTIDAGKTVISGLGTSGTVVRAVLAVIVNNVGSFGAVVQTKGSVLKKTIDAGETVICISSVASRTSGVARIAVIPGVSRSTLVAVNSLPSLVANASSISGEGVVAITLVASSTG